MGADEIEADPDRAKRRRGRKPPRVAMGEGEIALLSCWAAGRPADLPPALVQRAGIVLACARGASNGEVAEAFGVSAHLVGRWRARYARGGVDALVGEAPAGAPVQLDAVGAARFDKDGLPEWASATTVARAVRGAALRPGEGGAIDVAARLVGLHVHVSDVVFALSSGEMASPTAARAEPFEAFGALRTLTRKHLAVTTRRSDAAPLKRFLKEVMVRAPAGPIHLVVHRQPGGIVRRFVERRPRLLVHDAGTLHAWWSLLEAWSASAPDCAAAVLDFVADATREPRPFAWHDRPRPAGVPLPHRAGPGSGVASDPKGGAPR